MRVLVIGATGGSGRQLVAQALERGYHVTALVRNPARLPARSAGLSVVVGDVLDPPSVVAAVKGQDAVLSALGHKRWFYPNRILSEGTRTILAAMAGQGVRRFICETALGIGGAWWRMGLSYTLLVRPFVLPFYFSDKVRQEALIRASGLDWTIVRPGVLTNGPRLGTYRHWPDRGALAVDGALEWR